MNFGMQEFHYDEVLDDDDDDDDDDIIYNDTLIYCDSYAVVFSLCDLVCVCVGAAASIQ